MKAITLILLASALLGCAPREIVYEDAVVIGTNPNQGGMFDCANGADWATVQFRDGRIMQVCMTAPVGHVVKIRRP